MALAYNDNGAFHVKVLTRKEMTLERAGVMQTYQPGGVISDIVVNRLLRLNYESTPIPGIYNPLITCCFCADDASPD